MSASPQRESQIKENSSQKKKKRSFNSWSLCVYFKLQSSSSHHVSQNHRWFHNQFPPFFPVLHCPLGLGELQACPFPDFVFPPLPLSALSSPPFTVPCKMVLAKPDERETWPYHCSLRLFTIVRRSSCGPIACWILARTSSLVTWSLYEMCSILR